MANIKPGDVVQLKSGGPLMTVEKIVGDSAKCDWFDEKHKQCGGIFPLHSLVIDETPGSIEPDGMA
jgi:uncharacterized protein YodC (DUF2158 family)